MTNFEATLSQESVVEENSFINEYVDGKVVSLEGQQLGIDIHRDPTRQQKLVIFFVKKGVLGLITKDDVENLAKSNPNTVYAAHVEENESLTDQEAADLGRVRQLMEEEGLQFFLTVKAATDYLLNEDE